MDKIKKRLNKNEKIVFDWLVKSHKNGTCGCSLDNPNDIYMCPIGLHEDGCTDDDLIKEIKELTEICKDELDDMK